MLDCMAMPDEYPSAEAVAADLECSRVAGCAHPEQCWQLGHCYVKRHGTVGDPKNNPRVRDVDAIKEKLLRVRECYSCGQPPSDGHHVLFRSNGGDDVPENIAPLCHVCHMLLHQSVGDGSDGETVRRNIGEFLIDNDEEVILYVMRRLGVVPGADYLKRRYFISGGKVPGKYGGMLRAEIGDRIQWGPIDAED